MQLGRQRVTLCAKMNLLCEFVFMDVCVKVYAGLLVSV